MDRTAEDDADQWRSAMVDVSGLSLTDLAALDESDTVLAACLRRLAAERVDPGEPIAGFNSAL